MALGEYRGPRRMDAFAAYVVYKARQRHEQSAFRNYIADSLHYQGKGMFIGHRLDEILHPPEAIDPEEVLAGVIEGAGLEVVE